MKQRWVAYGTLAVAAVLLTAVLWLVLGPLEHSPLGAGRDWGLHFYPATQRFLARQDPYSVAGVYNPPWLFLALAPLMPFSERLSWVLLAVGTLALTLGTAVRFAGRSRVALLMAATSPYLLTTMLQGQVDGVGLAGLLLAASWWVRGTAGAGVAARGQRTLPEWLGPALAQAAALLLLTAKPQAALLVVALLVWRLLAGPWRHWAAAVAAAAAIAGLCIAWAGWDAPRRLAQSAQAVPPLPLPRVDTWISLERMGLAHPEWILVPVALSVIGLLFWTYRREGWSDRLLCLAVAGGLLVTPYLSGPSLLLGTGSAVPWLAGRRRWWAAVPAYLLAWAASFLRWDPTFQSLGIDLWPGIVLFLGLVPADGGPAGREGPAAGADRPLTRAPRAG